MLVCLHTRITQHVHQKRPSGLVACGVVKTVFILVLGGLLHIVVLGSSLGPIYKLCYVFDMFFGIGLKGVPKAGFAPQEHGAAPNKFLCSPFVPAGSGRRPSSASSGAGEAECW